MKKAATLFTLVILFCLALPSSHASVAVIYGPENKSVTSAVDLASLNMQGLENLSVEEFLALSPKDIQARTGQKMSLKDKIGFGLAKMALKKQVKKAKRTGEWNPQEVLGGFTFHIGGFLLGLILGIIGFAIALFISEDAWKSSLIGLGVWLVVILVAFIL